MAVEKKAEKRAAKKSEKKSEKKAGTTSKNDKNAKKKETRQKTAEPENAIGKEAAKEKALTDAGVTAEQAGKVKSRISQLDDGTVIYKVSFIFDGQKYSYQINAVSGEVVEKSTEDAVEDTTSQSAGQNSNAEEANNA